jgi:hypothetical protein
MDQDENKSPLFGSWRNFYFAVVIFLILQIILYYLFTQFYS